MAGQGHRAAQLGPRTRRYQTGALRARDRVWGRLDYTAGKGIGNWKPGFFTPTMKQEIWSTVMESHHPDHPEWFVPSYCEPPHAPKDGDRIKEYPLTATTGRRIPVYFHSEHRQLPWCRELWPVPRVEINPKTAAEYGIEQGDWVWIETEWGKIREVADLYYGVKEDVINLEHTWWYPEVQDAGHGWQLSQVNQLIDHDAQDPHAGSSNPARLPGEDLQGHARELAVRQPRAVRQHRKAHHPHFRRPASEGMAAYL